MTRRSSTRPPVLVLDDSDLLPLDVTLRAASMAAQSPASRLAAPIAGAQPFQPTSSTLLAVPPIPCREGDPDLWFSDEPAEIRAAKRGCFNCPIRLKCLTDSLERREVHGVWGGFDEKQRRRALKNRPVPGQVPAAATA